MNAWRDFHAEIGRWRDEGRAVEFWLRDDDATRLQDALGRLLEMTGRLQIPLALAVIPQRAEPGLFTGLPPHVDVLQHGFDHANRAPQGAKKSEYPPQDPAPSARERLCAGRDRLQEIAGARSIDVLAPPWNRVAAELVPHLAAWGFRGLTRYGPRAAQRVPGLVEVNTHVDLIAWKAGRGFVGVEPAIRQALQHLSGRRQSKIDCEEPTGWLTHHAVHDTAAWNFLEELFARLRNEPGVRWRSARELFASAAPSPAGR